MRTWRRCREYSRNVLIMLKSRILATLKFFDLQNVPLTLLELHRFLIAEPNEVKPKLNSEMELVGEVGQSKKISVDELLNRLEQECQTEVVCDHGYYCLQGRSQIIKSRLDNYLYGIHRERLIRRFVPLLKFIPFVRGVGVGGSQALGPQTENSDIDLFTITAENRMWIARTLVTLFLQLTGRRRHGKKVANCFCLNHYVAGVRTLPYGHDAYNAMEYFRMRPVVYPNTIKEFQNLNAVWCSEFFPNALPATPSPKKNSRVQLYLEKMLNNGFGDWLEERLQTWQLHRIQRGEFIVAEKGEISFYSKARKLNLLRNFFEFQK